MKKRKLSAVQAWKMLMLSLPKGIAAFVTVVAGLSVSLPLSVFLVGIPLLAETLVLCARMMEAERLKTGVWLYGRTNDEADGTFGGPASRKWAGWKALLSVIGQGRSYRGILYGLLQLPVGIAAFTTAVVLPVTAWAVMLSPLAYQVSTRIYSFDLFGGDIVMNRLLPALSSYERSWVYAGVGALLVLLMPAVLRALGRLYAGWIAAVAGPETQADPVQGGRIEPFPVERLQEPQLN